MGYALIGLGGVWIGGTLGIVLGGFLASVKARDLDAAYQHLSDAIHQYLEECARQANAPAPDQLIVLRRIVAEADLLAGLTVAPAAAAGSGGVPAENPPAHTKA